MNSAIEARRSIRKYQNDKMVTKSQLTQLVHAAMLAPSAKNSRPWEFIVITKREILDEVARIHLGAGMFTSAPAAIAVVAIEQEGFLEGFFPQCCSAAIQNILLEAVDMGLGTCWCGIHPKEDRVATFSALFNLEAPKIPFGIIAVGYPDDEPAMRGFFEESKVSYIE